MGKQIKGFLTKKTPSALKKESKRKDPCEVCGLHENVLTPKMAHHGEGRKGILCVAEGPGREEDRRGEQLIGEAGTLLENYMRPFDIDLHKDCWLINAVNCRPPQNRTPTAKEIKCCRWLVEKTIEETNPKIIFLFGRAAVESFYAGMGDCSIGRWKRFCIPDHEYHAHVIPLFHPSYLVRNQGNEIIESVFRRDLKFAASCIRKPRPTARLWENEIKVVTDIDELSDYMMELLRERRITIGFDFETTSLKPFGPLQRIVSCSIAFHKNHAIAFPVSHPFWTDKQKDEVENLLKAVLFAANIKKVAHNLKFEDMWARACIGPVRGWEHCTMNGAHIIDSRKGITGLKFQTFVNWGVKEYDADIKPFIIPDPRTGLNTLTKAPLKKLLTYNAFDSLFTYNLYEKQMKIFRRMKDPRRKANYFFLEGLKTLSNATMEGIPVDEIYYKEEDLRLDREIKLLTESIITDNGAKQFEKQIGRPIKILKDISTDDLRTLFFKVLKVKTKKEKLTTSGLNAIDRDVLSEIKHPLANKILERRRLYKLKNTYLAQFLREVQDGKIHPFYDLHTARSYRSSSSLPNFQNIPYRDEESKKLIRKGILPSPGNQILCCDYASIEVRIGACYTKDPELIMYINDPTTDMHKDEAKELFRLSDRTVTKMLRFYAKNQFVFPEFYGSYFVNCARNLWNECIHLKTGEGITVREHLRNKLFHGCTRSQEYTVFENHVKRVEEKFWDKFSVFRQWQQRMISDYIRKGYVQYFTGFQRNDTLSRNMIFNSAIQGTAFHCLLWSMIELDNALRGKRMKTRIISQIHDEIVFDLFPPEREKVLELAKKIMTESIREVHNWIIVPLEIEAEITPVGGAWYYKKEIGELEEAEQNKITTVNVLDPNLMEGYFFTNHRKELMEKLMKRRG